MNKAIQQFEHESNFGYDEFNPDQALLLDQVARSYCNSPIRVPSRHWYRDISANLYVPCGTCEQCRNTAANDLVTRFFHDVTRAGHAYFITLTYPSFRYANQIPPILYSLFWHKDCDNFSHKLSFSPCLLDYSHVQAYIKLLRIRLDRKYGKTYLSMICTGELGHRHGRPHWHILFISNKQLTLQDFRQSWIDTIQTPARVDYKDLVKNGTIYAREDLSSPISGKKSTKKCVKYIIKYSTKASYLTSNCSRLNLALPFLQSLDPYNPSFLNTDTFQYVPSQYQLQRLKSIIYENYSQKTKEQNPLYKTTQKYHNAEDLSKADIYSLFGTHKQLSTSNSIGKLYALANLTRFASGNTRTLSVPSHTATLHPNQTNNSKALSTQNEQNRFPRYYRILTDRCKLPLSKVLKTIKNTLQCCPFTMHDYTALYSLWDSYGYLFYRNTRDSVPLRSLRPLTYEDLSVLGITLSDSQLYTLFPDYSGKSTTRFHEGVRHIDQVYFKFRSSRIFFALAEDINGGLYPAIAKQEYDHDLRYWKPSRITSPAVFVNSGYLPLLAYKKQYCDRWNELVEQSSVVDTLLKLPQFVDAIQRNREDWEYFKQNKDLQTVNNNAYD